MKKSAVIILAMIMMLCFAACVEKQENANQGQINRPQEGFDLDSAAQIGGNRLEQAIKEHGNNSGLKETMSPSQPVQTLDPDEPSMEGFDVTRDPEETHKLHHLGDVTYADSLSDEEKAETEKIAEKYAKKKLSIKSPVLETAAEDDSAYMENLIYGRGNIIVYLCSDASGKTHKIVVARIYAGKDWKVIE